MKLVTTSLVILILPVFFAAGTAVAEKPSLKCDIGPVKKTYGKTPWLVYSCGDDKTLVVVSDTGSPAMPFYFIFHYKEGKYHLYGEGTGKKEATAAAFDDLGKLTEPDIRKLIAETLQARNLKQQGR